MTDDSMALIELLQTTDDADLLKSVVELTLERLMAFEVEGLFGAAKHERSESRLNYRNGYRARALDTRLGTLELGIPGLPGNLLPAVPRAAQDVRANQPAQAPVQRQLDAIVRDAVAGLLDAADQIEQRTAFGHEVDQRPLFEHRPAGAEQLLGGRVDEHHLELPVDRRHAAGH
jgi:putative transposase